MRDDTTGMHGTTAPATNGDIVVEVRRASVDGGDAMTKVSVVIATKVGAPFVDQCLDSVRAGARALQAEVIVVAFGTDAYREHLRAAYPWALVLHPQGIAKIPALRRRGVEASSGEYVAVIEEHCSAAADWLATGIAAHARGNHAAVGGPIVDFDYGNIRDWVVYFLEYNGALPPAPDGTTSNLNDANIMYRREALTAHLDLLGEGYWPMTLHPTLLAEGRTLLSVPGMIVHHRGPFSFGYYLRQRFLFSRAYAGVRARNQSALKRWAYILGAPLVPLVLLARIGRNVISKRCRVGKFVAALPLLAIALLVLVAGEWVGSVLGPGDALSKVE
jgi:glycosyltransferase involved in cell wall biosynthesis